MVQEVGVEPTTSRA